MRLRVLLLSLCCLLCVVPAVDAKRSTVRMQASKAKTSTRWVSAPRKVVKPVTAKAPTTTPTPSAAPATTAPSATTPAVTQPPALPPVTPATPQNPATILPSRTGVELREFSVVPTRNPLAAGAIELDVTNYGEDDHDLTVADSSGHVVATTGDLAPQAAGALKLSAAAGSYKIYCSLYNGAHDRAGMHETLVVK